MLAPLQGELRRLPPNTALRLLQAVTLFTLLRSLTAAIARYALGYRHLFILRPGARELILEHQRTLLGRSMSRARTVLPLEQLQEITLERAGESPSFAAGLAALAAGTFFGSRLISEGLLVPSGAPWLLGGGAILILLGVLLDFFVGSGRTPTRLEGSPELSLRVSKGRGWVLARLEPKQADNLLKAIEHALATGERLPESLAHRESPESSPVPSPEPSGL